MWMRRSQSPRLQKSNWRNNDIRKRRGTITIKEAEAQYKEQHRSRTSWSRRLHKYFGPSISWKHKDTRLKITSYIRITRAPFCCKRMGGKHREVVTSSEGEILFSYGPSQEREPKDNLLSHRRHDCRLHDGATAGREVSQVLSGNHGTISEETRRFEKNFYIYIWITDKTED